MKQQGKQGEHLKHSRHLDSDAVLRLALDVVSTCNKSLLTLTYSAAEAALMAFLGERRRLEGDVCGKHFSNHSLVIR